jgi:hypothetical protein
VSVLKGVLKRYPISYKGRQKESRRALKKFQALAPLTLGLYLIISIVPLGGGVYLIIKVFRMQSPNTKVKNE